MTIEQRTTETVRIDPERLWDSLSKLGEIGAYLDDETGLIGVRRLALTDEDVAGRRLVLSWFADAGLEITLDRVGNVRARRPGLDDSLAPVVIGSHVDSVATAGRFDGCLGVLGGLEAKARSGWATRHRRFISSIADNVVKSFPAIRMIARRPRRHSARKPDSVMAPPGNASAAASASLRGVSGPIASWFIRAPMVRTPGVGLARTLGTLGSAFAG